MTKASEDRWNAQTVDFCQNNRTHLVYLALTEVVLVDVDVGNCLLSTDCL